MRQVREKTAKDIGGSILKNIIKEVAKAHGISEQEAMTFSTGGSFPSGAICFHNACAVGSVLFIAALMVQENKLCS